MTKDLTKQAKSTTDLYYDFFCLLHLPVICSVNPSSKEELQTQSCPLTNDSEKTIASSDGELNS